MAVIGNVYIGGIAGYHYLGTISDCISTGNVNGNRFCGGIIGFGSFAVVENCRSTGDVKADSHVGGIVGWDDACDITGCTAKGDVSGNEIVGGIAGLVNKDGAVRNCSFNGKISGDTLIGDIAGLIANGSVANPDGSSEDGLELIYEDGKPMITISSRSADGKIKSIKTITGMRLSESITVEYRLKSGEEGVLRIRKIDARSCDVVIPDIIYTADGTEYRVTTTEGKAFRDLNADNVVLPASIKTVNAGTFKGSRIKTITLTAEKASDLKIKKGAFDEIKKPGSTTVVIRTSSKKQFNKIVEKCRKAGGTKLKYVYESRH